MLVTVKSKAVRFVVTVSSVTEMTMLEVMPTSKFVSVPVRAPVEVSKLAQLGLLVIPVSYTHLTLPTTPYV